MKKEEVYINLQGKTKEELTDLWEFLTSNGEKPYRDLESFLEYSKENFEPIGFSFREFCGLGRDGHKNKTEVTIQQLKEILQPMETFTPIAMKCTQEQFAAVKPKLVKTGKIGLLIEAFESYNYITNNYGNGVNYFDFIDENKDKWDFKLNKIYNEWNEEIFLKACGIEVETLQEKATRLENELKEVKQQIEEKNNIKIGDWVKRTYNGIELFKADDTHDYRYINSEKRVYQKITNPELIKLIEDETNENNLFR